MYFLGAWLRRFKRHAKKATLSQLFYYIINSRLCKERKAAGDFVIVGEMRNSCNVKGQRSEVKGFKGYAANRIRRRHTLYCKN